MDRECFHQLVASYTRPGCPTLCGELRTLETVDLIPLWEAMEKLEGRLVEPPFWACSWPGSQALARYVLDHPEMALDRVILDLGCGNGVAAIAGGIAGGKEVLASDIDPAALWMTDRNARENLQDVRCVAEDLLGDTPPVPGVDLILAGDLFYARWMAIRVEPWLRAAVATGAEVLVGDPGRAYLPGSGLELLESYDVPVPCEIESVDFRTTGVYRMSRGGR